ncbi:hypothetical protein Ancab_009864 [Ancistrocladus abbreviatus]
MGTCVHAEGETNHYLLLEVGIQQVWWLSPTSQSKPARKWNTRNCENQTDEIEISQIAIHGFSATPTADPPLHGHRYKDVHHTTTTTITRAFS